MAEILVSNIGCLSELWCDAAAARCYPKYPSVVNCQVSAIILYTHLKKTTLFHFIISPTARTAPVTLDPAKNI